MPYKRSEDQYRTPRAREMIEELNTKSKCTSSTIRNYRKILFEGHEHAGVLTHVCILNKGHEGNCKCSCEMEWKSWL